MLSIVIPTLNSARTLDACLSSIRAQQRAPAYEIVMADAGSTDETVAIAQRHGVERIVPNPLLTGEAGKSAGIAACRGDLIALIDSDNILPDTDWLHRMTAPFADPEIVGAEPLAYTCRATDPALTRYFALLGMNDPLCLFLGNYDRFCAVTGRWTGLPVVQIDAGDYLKLTLSAGSLPTIGANGFVFRRSLLDQVPWQPYLFDIDLVHQAIAAGHPHFAKVKCGIVHLYCDSLGQFRRKQARRVRDFLYFAKARGRSYPWQQQRLSGILVFILCTISVIPLLVQQMRGMRRHPDRAWWYHLPVCAITLWTYGTAVLAHRLGLARGPQDRSRWQR
jgi:glycosyltransferase involved in cell wall biosynthesis